MSNKLNRLQTAAAVEQVFRTKPNEAQFNASLEQLDDFISAQLAGEEYEALFPGVAAYLDTDPRLAKIYDRLYRLEVDARENNLQRPLSRPTFNLDFLPSAGFDLIAWLRQFVSDIPIILGFLNPDRMPAMALRGDRDDSEPRQYTYYADPYRVFLGITPGIVAQAEAQIDGNVMNDQDMDEDYQGKVCLFREQDKLQEVPLDELGFFGLDQVEAGQYSLLVMFSTHSIWIEDLAIP